MHSDTDGFAGHVAWVIGATGTSGGHGDNDVPVGVPRDVSESVAYLLSERSGFMNGTVLRVDGGVR